MCGITGWVDFQQNLSKQQTIIQSMTNTLMKRGPDDNGVWLDKNVALGHCRLAVIDLNNGQQPMSVKENDHTSAVLTFCGEIYNFKELRTKLISIGHEFRTQSDTEVILHSYLEWGDHFVEKLNGMYAIAIWDTKKEELLLIRDRMGIKPLYYFPLKDGVLFGSEPKAIFTNPLSSRRVNADGLCEVLDMVKTPERTPYMGMYEVRPGYLVKVCKGKLTKHSYWKLEAQEHSHDQTTTIQTIRELLEDIVTRQLVSDVPLCTLLSGGLDSSSLTALAAKIIGSKQVKSFSLNFSNQFESDAVRGSSDAQFALELAQHVGSNHTEVLLNSDELLALDVRKSVLEAVDAPPTFWGDMWPSLYLLFRSIREHATVAISGEGADEIFGGYRWFYNPNAIQANTFPWLTSGSARFFGGLGLLNSSLLKKLDIIGYRRERYNEALAEVPILQGEDEINQKMRVMTYLNTTRFMQTLLDRKDRMSMALGLEVRVPFCDHRLVNYLFNVPWHMKTFDGREKSLLRAACSDLLPKCVVNRVKTPYPVIQNPSYEEGLRNELIRVINNPDSPVIPLIDIEKAKTFISRPLKSVSQPYNRGNLEVILWLNKWLNSYEISLEI